MKSLLQRRASDDRIASAVTGFEQVHRSLAGGDDHLRDEAGIFGCGEDRLDSIGLRAHAVDEADVLFTRRRVNVVSPREDILVFGRGERRGKNTPSSPSTGTSGSRMTIAAAVSLVSQSSYLFRSLIIVSMIGNGGQKTLEVLGSVEELELVLRIAR